MQNAFDRQKRNRRRGERGPVVGSGPAAPRQDSLLAPPDGTAEPEPEPAPALDVSARKALVKQAAGKSTRQVQELLAGVDPELALPADKVRPLGNGRYEMKVVIDAECHRALEQLRGLLSHVDPHMTLGQLVGRLAREGLDRHDPARPPRRPRTGNRSASGDGTSAPKTKRNPDGQARSAAHRNAQPTRAATSAPKRSAPAARAIPVAVKRHVWNRDGGRCSYVDPRSRRRCASRHLLQIDHVFPYALGGRAEPANLRLLCATHHRHRHEGRASPREPAE